MLISDKLEYQGRVRVTKVAVVTLIYLPNEKAQFLYGKVVLTDDSEQFGVFGVLDSKKKLHIIDYGENVDFFYYQDPGKKQMADFERVHKAGLRVLKDEVHIESNHYAIKAFYHFENHELEESASKLQEYVNINRYDEILNFGMYTSLCTWVFYIGHNVFRQKVSGAGIFKILLDHSSNFYFAFPVMALVPGYLGRKYPKFSKTVLIAAIAQILTLEFLKKTLSMERLGLLGFFQQKKKALILRILQVVT